MDPLVHGSAVSLEGWFEEQAEAPVTRALPCRRGMGKNRRREEFGWGGGEQGGRARLFSRSEAKRSKGDVSFLSPSEKNQTILTKPNNRLPKNETAISARRRANREEIEREEIWGPYHSPDRAGSGTDGRFGRRRRNAGWMERDLLLVVPPFSGRGRERKGGAVSSVVRTDGGAPDRTRGWGLLGGVTWESLVCFCLPGNVWWLFWACVPTNPNLRNPMAGGGEGAIFFFSGGGSRSRSRPPTNRKGHEAGRSRREKKILRSLLLLAVVDPSKQLLFWKVQQTIYASALGYLHPAKATSIDLRAHRTSRVKDVTQVMNPPHTVQQHADQPQDKRQSST